MRACPVVLLLLFTAVNASSQATQQGDKRCGRRAAYFTSLVDPACAVVKLSRSCTARERDSGFVFSDRDAGGDS